MKPLLNPFFAKFIIYFNENQDYFECHEELEEYWKSIPNTTKEHPLTSYILLATGMYHWRRGNAVGALRTLKKAMEKMASLTEEHQNFSDGIDFNDLRQNITSSIQAIEEGQAFTSFPIKVTSTEIDLLIAEISPTMALLPFGSDAVIHKHMLRDRSDILHMRDEKKKGRLN